MQNFRNMSYNCTVVICYFYLMKNALILFGIVLPVLIINQLVFNGNSSILGIIIFTIPFIGLNFLLKKSHSEYSKKEVFKKVFMTCLRTGFFYAIWMGSYQFLLVNYFKPTMAQELLIEIEANMQSLFPERAEELTKRNAELFTQPIFWISSHLLNYSFLFSLIGLILGFQFKSKAAQQ